VARESDLTRPPGKRWQLTQFLARRRVPEPNGLVVAGRGEQPAVGREGEPPNDVAMPGQPPALLAGGQVPEAGGVVAAARGDRLAVGRKRDGVDGLFRLMHEAMQLLARGRIADADEGTIPAEGHHLAIHREGYTVDLSLGVFDPE